jgi:hypothetical protein
VYWIPGAFEPKAATPIPKDEGSAVARDADLIFLPAYRAVGHAVLLGSAAKGEAGLQLVAQLHGDANVARLNGPLVAVAQGESAIKCPSPLSDRAQRY